VLDAARARFFSDGFTATTIWLVAADAQVDVSQVIGRACRRSEPLMATLRGAMVTDQARDQLRDFIQARLLASSERLGSDPALRAGLATSLLMGMVVCRRIIGVPVLIATEPEELVTLIAPAIQQILVPQPTSATHSTRPIKQSKQPRRVGCIP
jgi:hypothetical protein